ncbi:hypothetical protein [uncultured Brevundimonas sp.]|uniref:hypothetical protein n=1 Tax=uncultured Brevundimonas sp. TaxID=213418 RepID=UPI0030EC10E2
MQKSSLRVGIDVPWVTRWTAEPVLGVRPCPTVGGALAIVQQDSPGVGRPLYSQNHAVRQRLTIGRMLCPMCGRPTPADDRWTQVAHPVSAGSLRNGRLIEGLPAAVADDQVRIDAGAIAPLHRACVDRSLKYCPHLKTDPNIDVRRFSERWLVLPLLVRAEAPPQMFLARAEPARAIAVVGFLQLVGLTGDRDPAWQVGRVSGQTTV